MRTVQDNPFNCIGPITAWLWWEEEWKKKTLAQKIHKGKEMPRSIKLMNRKQQSITTKKLRLCQ